jgi:hypothetical protein
MHSHIFLQQRRKHCTTNCWQGKSPASSRAMELDGRLNFAKMIGSISKEWFPVVPSLLCLQRLQVILTHIKHIACLRTISQSLSATVTTDAIVPRIFHTASLIPRRVEALGETLIAWPQIDGVKLVGDADAYRKICVNQGKRGKNCAPPPSFQ